MLDDTYDIQSLVNESGVARRTVYFYVQQGLLPPPQGAGLAAFYTGEHLLRLRLIPILRQKGFRLDQIRERFEKMSPEEMQNQVEEFQKAEAKKKTADAPTDLFPGSPLPDRAQIADRLGKPWGEGNFIHYNLPAGIVLVAPVNLSPLDRQRLQQLLQSAKQIFSSYYTQLVSHEPARGDHGEDPHDVDNSHAV